MGWTVRQKERNDRRDQWWKRGPWAADLVRSGDAPSEQIGLAALTAMIEESDDVTDGDAELLQSIIEVVLEMEDGDWRASFGPARRGGRRRRWMTIMPKSVASRVHAGRAQVALDKERGRQTPAWVREIAEPHNLDASVESRSGRVRFQGVDEQAIDDEDVSSG